MTGSFSSRNLPARGRLPVRTARLLCNCTATRRAILQRRLLVPRMHPFSHHPIHSATNNIIQNA